MRAQVLAIAVWTGLAASAAAIPYIPPPQPVYEAPIDRALQNVAAMEGLEPAQREQLLGRLNLLAYARNDRRSSPMCAKTTVEPGRQRAVHRSASAAAMRPAGDAPHEFRSGRSLRRVRFPSRARGKKCPRRAPATPSAGATARLEAARGHYARALELEPSNLRSRLGYAYVLDRLGRTNDARRELRCILKKGLPRLSGPQSEWEDHAVLTETAAHLAHLGDVRSDRAAWSACASGSKRAGR